MQLDTGVGLGTGYIVSYIPTPISPIKGGTAASIIGPCLLWLNDSMDQDATWYGGRPRPWPIFGLCLLWPNAGWIKIPLAREVHVGLGDKSGARVGLTDGERGAANKVSRQAFLRLFVVRALLVLPSAPIGYIVA